MYVLCGRLAAGLVVVGAVAGAAEPDVAVAPGVELQWLAELGAEPLAATPASLDVQGPVWSSVPGAALSFAVAADGSLSRLRRVAGGFSASYGLASTERGALVADRDGVLWLYAREAGEARETLRWRRALETPVMSVAWDGGEQVWVATRDRRLRTFRAADGEPLWDVDLGGRAEAPAVAFGADVFVATKDRSLFRIDTAKGRTVWTAELPGPVIHPPAVASGEQPLLACGTWNGHLSAFDMASGEELWSVELPARLASAPLVAGQAVVVTTEDGDVLAYDRSGQPLWKAEGAARGTASLHATGVLEAPPVAEASGDAPTPSPSHGVDAPPVPQVASLPAPPVADEPAVDLPRLLVASNTLVALDLATGRRLGAYPEEALDGLQRRFLEAMMEGEKTYSESEKAAAREREAFPLSGTLFGVLRSYGSGLLFGTEEGWIYLFDTRTLRPTFRYRAGQAVSAGPTLASGHLVAAAGEEVFGLDPASGRQVWRRSVGGTVRQLVGQTRVAVVAGERLSTLDAADGSRGWAQRGQVRSVSAPPVDPATGGDAGPWLVDDDSGHLLAFDAAGQAVGKLMLGGTFHQPLGLPGGRSWLIASRDGRVVELAWQPAAAGMEPGGELRVASEHAFPEPVVDVRPAGERVLVRFESGTLASVVWPTGEELWRLSLVDDEGFRAFEAASTLVIFGARKLKTFDLLTGEPRFEHDVASPVVGVELEGRELRWFDRAGYIHTAQSESGEPGGTSDLGVALERAHAGASGFLLRSAAGEIGVAARTAPPVPAEGTSGPGLTEERNEEARP